MPSGRRFDGKSGHSINPLCQELWNQGHLELRRAKPAGFLRKFQSAVGDTQSSRLDGKGITNGICDESLRYLGRLARDAVGVRVLHCQPERRNPFQAHKFGFNIR